MKIKLNIDSSNKETEVTISAPEMDKQIEYLCKILQEDHNEINQLEVFKANVYYYLNLDKILFFETDSKIVMTHTAEDVYQVKYKLYELENLLNNDFMRVSKSTIINLKQIYAITRSISNCRIQFQNSYKAIYVSRHYYYDLFSRLNERRKVL